MSTRECTAVPSAESSALPRTIAEAGEWLRSGKTSCLDLARAHLARIAELEPRLNAFITLMAEEALATAAELDADLRGGRDLGPLHGIPLVAKDLFDTGGIRTTVGSKVFEHRVPANDAAAIRQLKAAGAVFLGKTNMNELAAGVTGTNETYGDTHNPWRRGYSPGGSSGGSAAAVAAGLCLGAAASDTGGSIRIPASWCGVAGIRPTPGLVSVEGVHPRGPSLDVAGPMAGTVPDLALLLDAMADPAARPVAGYAAAVGEGLAGLRLGIVRDYTYKGVDDAVAAAVRRAVETFSDLGATVVEIEVPALAGDANHAQLFNDILLHEFSRMAAGAQRGRERDFGAIVRRNIADGERISRETYRESLRMQAALSERMEDAFDSVDAVLTPAQPMVAPPLHAPRAVFARGRHFVLPFSLARLPAVVLPCGFDAECLPIGLQIVGNRSDDATILRVAAAFEAGTNYHRRPPPCGGE